MTRRGQAGGAKHRASPAVGPDAACRALPPPVGFDPIAAGKYRWSGVLPSFKAPRDAPPCYIFTSALEAHLGLWLELHPLIKEYGRIDVHERAAERLGLRPVRGMALCHPVQHVGPGGPGWGLGDAGAVWSDGSLVWLQAGIAEYKTSDEARAALDAQRAYMAALQGRFFLYLKGDLTRRWFIRALWLHLWRFAYYGPQALLGEVELAWATPRSARSIIKKFAGRARADLVQHAVLKAAGDAYAEGRLTVDLTRVDFDLDTVVRVRRVGEPVAVPKPLRTEVPAAIDADGDDEASPMDDQAPGYRHPELVDPDQDPGYWDRLAAMAAIDRGASAASQAKGLGLTPRRVQMLRKAYTDPDPKVGGDQALRRKVRTGIVRSNFPARVREAATRLLLKDPHLTPLEVATSKELRDALRSAHLPGEPRIERVKHLMAALAEADPRIGPRPATRAILTEAAASGYTAIYDLRPGFLCEYDEEITNLAVQLVPGTPDTDRTRRLKLEDIGTKSPLSLVCSTRTTDQGDLRRMLLRAARPKDALVAAAGCKHAWPIVVWPMVLRGDNAWANSAHMLLRALPPLGVYLEWAPAKRPEKKGTIESGIGADQKIHEDQQPNATKGNPRVRGTAQPERFAAEHGIRLPEVEADFIRLAVDGELWGWHKRDRRRPIDAWQAGARKYGVRVFGGDMGELVRVLKRPIGSRKVTSHGISYLGDDYVTLWGGDADDDPRNELPHRAPRRRFMRRGTTVECWIDDDDVRTMDIYNRETAAFLGVAVCNRIGLRYRRPVSAFEKALEEEAQAPIRARGTASRQLAARHLRRRNQDRPRKRVARQAARIEERIARHRETVGAPAPSRKGASKGPATRVAPAPVPVSEPPPSHFSRKPVDPRRPEIRLLSDPTMHLEVSHDEHAAS